MSNDILKLKSGKEIYCHGNIIGIDDKLEISQGYDGGMPYTPNHEYWAEADEYSQKLTKEEALELADIMINRWVRFKEANLNVK